MSLIKTDLTVEEIITILKESFSDKPVDNVDIFIIPLRPNEVSDECDCNRNETIIPGTNEKRRSIVEILFV